MNKFVKFFRSFDYCFSTNVFQIFRKPGTGLVINEEDVSETLLTRGRVQTNKQ